MSNQIFHYGADHLLPSIALGIAKGKVKGVINEDVKTKINKSASYIEKIAQGDKPVYGINTGFGPLCTTQISPSETKKLQHNLLISHSVGVGPKIDNIISKLMMILKVHALSQGFSGIRLSTIERIMWMIEEDVIPVVPAQGSVGASGDLAPLSHLFIPLIGEGEVIYKGKKQVSIEVLEANNLAPIILEAKEGLGLINGTQFIAAHAVMVVDKMHNLLDNADICGALMVEGLLGSASPFTKAIHDIRNYKGISYVAERMRNMLADSEINNSHDDCERVQDPYSLRCIPQVHGSSRNAWLHLKEMVEIEINSVTDNPIIFSSENTISGGNFHGQPLAMVLDYAAIAIAELGNISDRRSYLALEGIADGVPKLLMNDLGTNSGFMIPQYTAAAIVSENKSLLHPASADSIPTSLGQEDHVSMGSISGRKALQIAENVEKVLGIELLSACQAIDFHRPMTSSKVLDNIHKHVRSKIKFIDQDVVLYPLMNAAIEIIKNGELINIEKTLSNDSDLKTTFDNF
jgi:histidine ammonia-lyase